MPLNHYQQEVGPSLADASPGKMPDVALLEGRYCSDPRILISLPLGIRLQVKF